MMATKVQVHGPTAFVGVVLASEKKVQGWNVTLVLTPQDGKPSQPMMATLTFASHRFGTEKIVELLPQVSLLTVGYYGCVCWNFRTCFGGLLLLSCPRTGNWTVADRCGIRYELWPNWSPGAMEPTLTGRCARPIRALGVISGSDVLGPKLGGVFMCFEAWVFPRTSQKAVNPLWFQVGETINGKAPYQKGDEFIPAPPPPKPCDRCHFGVERCPATGLWRGGGRYDGPLADANYKASNEDPEDVFQPDEDMLEAKLAPRSKKSKKYELYAPQGVRRMQHW